MITNKYTALATLAACALALTALGSAKNPVPRPFSSKGHLEATAVGINGTIVTFKFTDTGEATHIGRYSNEGTFGVDATTGQLTTGSGVNTAANGDTLSWISVVGPGAGQFTITWTGGTGRFANVSGQAVGTSANLVQGPTAISFDYTSEGAITY